MDALELLVVRDEEEPDAAEVLADGTVGDRRYRFLLDTGAARSSVLFDSYTATFPTTKKSESSGVFARNSYDLITVPSFQAGPLTQAPFTLARALEDSGERRNLIGMDLLSAFSCHFRFDENLLVVAPQRTAEEDLAWFDLFLDERLHPYVDVFFGEIEASAVWDTGAGITVVDLGFVERYPALFQSAGSSMGTDSTGTQQETPMFWMESPLIGGQRFARLRVAGVDLAAVNATIERQMDIILGYNALRQANWLFDFPRRRWIISRMLET